MGSDRNTRPVVFFDCLHAWLLDRTDAVLRARVLRTCSRYDEPLRVTIQLVVFQRWLSRGTSREPWDSLGRTAAMPGSRCRYHAMPGSRCRYQSMAGDIALARLLLARL